MEMETLSVWGGEPLRYTPRTGTAAATVALSDTKTLVILY